MLRATCLTMLFALFVSSTAAQVVSADDATTKKKSKVNWEFTRTLWKVSKASSDQEAPWQALSLSLPLDAEVTGLKVEFANCKFGKGESDYGTDAFSTTPLNGYDGQSGEWHKSFAKARFKGIEKTKDSQVVTVEVKSWKHDNSRMARLRVAFKTHQREFEFKSPASGKIGQARVASQARSMERSVEIPLDAKIVSIVPEFGNWPWGSGESDYGTSAFSAAPLVGYKGSPYKEWGKGFAAAHFIGVEKSDASKRIRVLFKTWKHDNSRKARLTVKFSK